MTVHKFGARVRDGAFSVDMPQHSHVVSVQMQHGFPQMWAIVSPWKPAEKRWFRWYGTGHEIDHAESPAYVGTVQIAEYVWHLFEVKPYQGPAGKVARNLEDLPEPVDFNDPRIR